VFDDDAAVIYTHCIASIRPLAIVFCLLQVYQWCQ